MIFLLAGQSSSIYIQATFIVFYIFVDDFTRLSLNVMGNLAVGMGY
jgi:hypothetical protein